MNTQRWIGLIVLVIAAVVAHRVVARLRAPGSRLSDPDPNRLMPELAKGAVTYTAARGKTLDYSPESVKWVEDMLAELHASRMAQQLSDRDVNLHALRFGAYIGEVLRRRYNGSWAIDHPVAGPQTFPIHWRGGESFPVGWCGKRILNGEEDNVWTKFQIVTSESYLSGSATQSAAENALNDRR